VVKHPDAPDVEFTISARSSAIVYNSKDPSFSNPTGMVYTVDKVSTKKGGVLPNVTTSPGAPLILRANAGAWVKVILNNQIPAAGQPASSTVGLHPQLVAYDVSSSDGASVGFNPNQIITAGAGAKEYWWYAGDLEMGPDGKIVERARELGAVNLCPAAPLNQDGNGLIGALIVEPANATWKPQDYVTQAADILDANGTFLFKDFVLLEQTNIAASTANTVSSSAVNNLSEELFFRLGTNSPTPTTPVWQVLSNSLPGATGGAPITPTFVAKAGDPVRFRVLQPGSDSINANIMFEIHGHSWQQEPWINSSRTLGDNPKSNVLGADILVPHKALNILIDQAGGPNKVPGDYLYYSFLAGDGAWGIFRVTP
jgi:hypothetical protein